MDDDRFDWIPAAADDFADLQLMLEEFYEEEQLAYDRDGTAAAVKELLERPSVGRIWMLRRGKLIAGYLIAIVGFGVEFGGRYVLLDELFIRPGFRGHGQWKHGFAEVERWAATAGIGFLRLEVNHHNARAKRLYLGYGFTDDERSILTKRMNRE